MTFRQIVSRTILWSFANIIKKSIDKAHKFNIVNKIMYLLENYQKEGLVFIEILNIFVRLNLKNNKYLFTLLTDLI